MEIKAVTHLSFDERLGGALSVAKESNLVCQWRLGYSQLPIHSGCNGWPHLSAHSVWLCLRL